MAKAFPNSRFFGFDYHPASIERAQRAAEEAGVADRVAFEVAPAEEFPGADYDPVAFFDCLPDMGDPVGAAQHVPAKPAKDGTRTTGEPFENGKASVRGRLWPSMLTSGC